ncbi:MAG: PAS domain S-box protein, partial [bacterium]
MKDPSRTNQELIEEISVLKQKIEESERKKAEEMNNLHSSIMKNIAEGVYLIRLVDGIIVYTNPKFENMFGYDPGEMIGKDVSIVNAPGDKTPEETKKAILDVIMETGEWHGEVENIKKDGTHFWCHANVSLFDHHEYGRVIVSVHTDITERKQAEEACRNAEARYRTLFEQSPNGILLIDSETGKTIEANETVCKQLGYTREEFAALRISDYEAAEKPEETAKHIQKVIRDGSDDFETLHRTKSGEIRNVHVWAKTIQLRDRHLFYTIFEDITESKRAQEKIAQAKEDWENTFDTVTDMITIHDEDFNIVRANPAAKAILGLQLKEGTPLVKCFRSYHGTENPPTGCPSCQCLQTGIPCIVEIFEPYLNMHLEIRAMPRIGSDGRVVGLIHVVRNITKRMQTDEQLQNTLESLRKAVGAIIQVMVSAVETRDPYTSGHQIRSADLARAIAAEMGLP